ncbi:hypothetical protein QFZ22_007100 [Streptomyces canus]|uniref:Uncharacterized protein n=1 Tax=Streptomyces canus TaxID=58343 RepID=A0AAW8FP67_9ACTN|nr:hypothetical protein [Streptomyces canus]MDQ0911115.1 hypothetical protein [Streptomyces canus]
MNAPQANRVTVITQSRRIEGIAETTRRARLSEVLIRRSPEGTILVMRHVPRLATNLAAAAALALTAPATAHATAIGSTPVHTFEYSVGGVTMKVRERSGLGFVILGVQSVCWMRSKMSTSVSCCQAGSSTQSATHPSFRSLNC